MKKTEAVAKPTRVMPASATQDVPPTLWPTTVTPSTVTPTTMAVKNPKMVINAFTDAQIRTWDPVFKASLEKAKSEMPKTYRELEILMEVLDSISNHMSVGHNSKEKLEIMMTVLEVQFNNYEISWENSMWDVSDDVFYEFEELYLTINEAVDKVNAALFESKKFLREKSMQRGRDRNNGGDLNNGRHRNKGRDCNNGGDRNNSGYRNEDAENVQKRPRSSKKTMSVQEHPRTSRTATSKTATSKTATSKTAMSKTAKNIQERPIRSKNVLQGLRRWYLKCTGNWNCRRRSWIPSTDTGASTLLRFQCWL